MLFRFVSILCAAGLTACAAQTPVQFIAGDACSVSASTYDSRELQCRFPKSQFAHKFRFKANFSGGHDDTVASIDALMNGAALACAAGSKTYLSAEDGDVSLWCDFAVAEQAQGTSTFKAIIRWSHAEYVDYQIAAQ